MTVKYIPIYIKYLPIFKAMGDGQIEEFWRTEIEYIENGRKIKPSFSNERADTMHMMLWADIEDINEEKTKKKQYDAERYIIKKKKTEE